MFLLVRVVKDGGAILSALVGSLPVECGGVVIGKKIPKQIQIADLRWVKGDFDGLGVTGFVRADFFVGGIGFVAACVSCAC